MQHLSLHNPYLQQPHLLLAIKVEDTRNKIEFKRGNEETKLNLNIGPFAYAEDGKFGLLAGASLEFWNLEKNYIQVIGGELIKGTGSSINIFGSFYFEALPRLYAGPTLGVEYKEHTGYAGLSLRLLGADPLNQKFLSILFTQIDMGLRTSSTPYGSLSFGLKLF